MKVSDFDFDLPPERIALRPMVPREAARLLHVGSNGFDDLKIGDLPNLFEPGDVLILNDTKVIPARLEGRIGVGRVEVNLHQPAGEGVWRAFARPGKRFRLGAVAEFAAGLTAEVIGKGEGGEITLRFSEVGSALMATLETAGTMPLPPYIARKRAPDVQDDRDYQTVFASRPGAVAAPTAGLHLTQAILDALDAKGVERLTVTLHVGAGTFLPVKAEDTRSHHMHTEWGEVSEHAVAALAQARAEGRRVTAAGTTALRIVEAAAAEGEIALFSGWTDIFITPGYDFRVIDRLFTNFHLPKSTLFMLVSALGGTAYLKAAYAHGVESGYRFYSYGDACLIDRLADDLP